VNFNDATPGKLHPGDMVREIQFILPADAELFIDDLLLYERGKS
jgi:hypothetical protein